MLIRRGVARAHREELVAGFRHVHHDARLEDLVVRPLAVVLLDDGRKELLVVRGADIGHAFRCSHRDPP